MHIIIVSELIGVEGMILPTFYPFYLPHSFYISVRHTHHPLPHPHPIPPPDIQMIIMSLGRELKHTGKYKLVKYNDTKSFFLIVSLHLTSN